MIGQRNGKTPYGWAMEEIKLIRDKDLIPALEALLKHQLWEVRYAAAVALSHMGEAIAIPHLVSAIEHIDYEYRDEIRDGLISIGKSDITALLDYLSSKSDTLMIIQVLGIIKNPSAIPILSQMLLNEHNSWAASSLGKIGGPNAIAALKQALQNTDRHVRFSAAKALGEIGITAMPVLIEALDNSEWWVREEASESLGRIGNEAALSKLEEIIQKESHPKVLSAAKFAYQKLSRKPSILIDKLKRNNQDREKLARTIEGKDKLPEHYYDYIRARSESLQEDDVELIHILGTISDETAIPILTQALIFGGTSQAAQDAIKQAYSKIIGPDITDFDYHRIKQIVGDAPQTRRAAAAALGALGSKKAIPALLQALKDNDSGVCETAVIALGKIGDEQAVPYLIEVLENNDSEMRQTIEEALKQCKTLNSIPQLVKRLGSGNWTIRKPAKEILLGMGLMAVKPLCEEYSKSNNSEERYRIVEVLGEVGDQGATHLLIEALESSDTSVGYAAVKSLAKIGRIEDEGFNKLVTVFKDKQKSYLHAETAVTLGQLASSVTDDNILQAARKALWRRRFTDYKVNVFIAYEKVVTRLTVIQVQKLP